MKRRGAGKDIWAVVLVPWLIGGATGIDCVRLTGSVGVARWAACIVGTVGTLWAFVSWLGGRGRRAGKEGVDHGGGEKAR